jgi:hypothetical protein
MEQMLPIDPVFRTVQLGALARAGPWWNFDHAFAAAAGANSSARVMGPKIPFLSDLCFAAVEGRPASRTLPQVDRNLRGDARVVSGPHTCELARKRQPSALTNTPIKPAVSRPSNTPSIR